MGLLSELTLLPIAVIVVMMARKRAAADLSGTVEGC